MKISYEEIVNVDSIGKSQNPIKLNDILLKANEENLKPANENTEQVLVIGIDVQQDFMDDGALGVPGANEDVKRFTKFIYDNMDKISRIAASIDTHIPHQIFHPCWFIDKNGKNPAPFTQITSADISSGKWTPVIYPLQTIEYLKAIETQAKKTLTIWPYHCLIGTQGCSLENQFSNMLNFFEIAKKSVVETIVKGTDPLSEMYGIIKPEYDKKNYINIKFLNNIEKFDKVIIGGEAKSHCVMESIRQILDYYKDKPEITSKIYILEDCMSVIPGCEQITEDTFNEFKKTYKINIVKSTDNIL
jgi:nicotinamidase-related amidase